MVNGTEPEKALSHPSAQAPRSVNLTDVGRCQTAERRTKAHLRREDPITCPILADTGCVRLRFGCIKRGSNRRKQIKCVKLGRNERQRAASGQHRLEDRASRCRRRSGSLLAIMVRFGPRRTVAGRLTSTVGMPTAETAMYETHGLCRDKHHKNKHRQEAEQWT